MSNGNSEDIQKVSDYLTNTKGLTSAEVAGIVGNMTVKSYAAGQDGMINPDIKFDVSNAVSKISENPEEISISMSELNGLSARDVRESWTKNREKTEETVSSDTQYTVSDITEILKDIDTMNSSFEANRQMFEAKDILLKACAVVGIGRLDFECIHNTLKNSNMTDEELDKIMHDEKKLTEMFFTKENGKPMKLKKVDGYTDFQVKREMIAYIYSLYVAEKEMNEHIDLVHMDVAETTRAATDVLVDQIAISFLRGVEAERQGLADEPDEEKRRVKERKLDSVYMAFTFDDVLKAVNENPRMVTNTIFDYGHETCIRRIGERYGKKRAETNTGSALYSIYADKAEDSIEAKFLRPNQYVKGYENLFVFLLTKYYGQASWNEKDSYMKERHNTACTLLRALKEGKLPKDDRDKYVENIAKVWKVFYDELTKNK